MLTILPKDQIDFDRYRAKVEADLANFPRGFVRTFNGLREEDKTRWFVERFTCLKSHLYLSGFAETENIEDPFVPVMGMDFQTDPHELMFSKFVQKRPGSGLALSDLSTQYKKFMILWSRGLFKTSGVIVDIVQSILNYPNIRICFLTGGDQLAKRQLARVKRVFEKPTKRFRFLFPEFCLKSVENKKIKDENNPDRWTDVLCKMGNAHEFTVPCRTNDTFAEPTFAISTAKSVKAGSHFELIFIDDLVNETNYRSVKLLEKCYQDYLDICPLLDPVGFMVLTGTRYSYGDTYERIQERAKEEEQQMGRTIWKFSIEDCWVYGCKNCSHPDAYHDKDVNILQPPCAVADCTCKGFESNGSKGVLFSEKRTHDGRSIGHTLEFLEGERIRLGAEFFANQYENNPIAMEAQTFTETLIGRQTLHSMEQIPPYAQSFTFGVGDLAYIGQEDKDMSVVYMCRLFQGQIFIYDCIFGNWDSGQVAENTVDALLIHRPNVLYYEKFNGWEAYDKIIAAYANSKGIPKVPIQWEKCSQAANAKIIRIGSIKGVLTSGRLWFYAGMKCYPQLVRQLLKWPKLGRHDDFADCAGQVVAAPTGYQCDAPPVVGSTTNWLRKLSQTGPVEDQYYDTGCGTGFCA